MGNRLYILCFLYYNGIHIPRKQINGFTSYQACLTNKVRFKNSHTLFKFHKKFFLKFVEQKRGLGLKNSNTVISSMQLYSI